MNYDLYFIPIIEKALENKLNKQQALKRAFEEIERLGKQASYRIGYQQFCMFMQEINFSKEDYTSETLERELTKHFDRPNCLSIAIEKNGRLLETLRFNFAGGSKTLNDITPGDYRLVLDTGLCLWSGILTGDDLIFSKGADGDTLKMAADSDGQDSEPVRTELLCDDMIELCLYTSLDNASMQITLKNIRI